MYVIDLYGFFSIKKYQSNEKYKTLVLTVNYVFRAFDISNNSKRGSFLIIFYDINFIINFRKSNIGALCTRRIQN